MLRYNVDVMYAKKNIYKISIRDELRPTIVEDEKIRLPIACYTISIREIMYSTKIAWFKSLGRTHITSLVVLVIPT